MIQRTLFAVLACLIPATVSYGATPEQTAWRFDFSGTDQPGWVSVGPGTAFTPQLGYGFSRESAVTAVPGGSCTSGKPFFFSLDVPEGNYNVTETLGDPSAESITTVKAEARRLVLERVKTPAGKTQKRSFTVNVRNRGLKSGGSVRLKPTSRAIATGTTCLRSSSAMFTPACVPWK